MATQGKVSLFNPIQSRRGATGLDLARHGWAGHGNATQGKVFIIQSDSIMARPGVARLVMARQRNTRQGFFTMMVTVKHLRLPIKLTNRNDGQGRHWSVSHDERIRAALIIPKSVPFDEPVVIHVKRILGKGERLWDASSILRGNWKQIEDALVERGWLHDDGPKWVTHVFGFQDASQRDNGPSVSIKFLQDYAIDKVDFAL